MQRYVYPVLGEIEPFAFTIVAGPKLHAATAVIAEKDIPLKDT